MREEEQWTNSFWTERDVWSTRLLKMADVIYE